MVDMFIIHKIFDANMHYGMAWTGMTHHHGCYNTVPGLVSVEPDPFANTVLFTTLARTRS